MFSQPRRTLELGSINYENSRFNPVCFEIGQDYHFETPEPIRKKGDKFSINALDHYYKD